jgi:hypothetical protein
MGSLDLSEQADASKTKRAKNVLLIFMMLNGVNLIMN